jgi:hypothetical protein
MLFNEKYSSVWEDLTRLENTESTVISWDCCQNTNYQEADCMLSVLNVHKIKA